MKYRIATILITEAALFTGTAIAQTSWQNSPLNHQNSELNYNSKNGEYGNNGNRIGYEVTAPSGVTTVFDNNGNRIGYTPSRR